MVNATVSARKRWNPVASVEAGVEYEITVPKGQEWKDWWISCGPDGYSRWWLRPFCWIRRSSDAPWFALMGAINDDPPFLIGNHYVFTPQADGELRCYANDAVFMYWNNCGSLSIIVQAVSIQT